MAESKEKTDFLNNLHSTLDATVWADEFVKIFQDIYGREQVPHGGCFYVKNPDDNIKDFREWVHSWMANALMTGHDMALSRKEKEYIYIVQSHTGEIVHIFNVEPDVRSIKNAYGEYLNQDISDMNESSLFCNVRLLRWNKWKGLETRIDRNDDSLYKWD
jgi:hypothetical protein